MSAVKKAHVVAVLVRLAQHTIAVAHAEPERKDEMRDLYADIASVMLAGYDFDPFEITRNINAAYMERLHES